MAWKTTQSSVGDIAGVLDELAPPRLAQAWDNVGLLAGDREAACRRVLLCIDLMPAVLEEAIAIKTDLILAYHPPIFKPIARLIAQSPDTDALVYGAIRAGIAIYSPHTALDAAPGGTNDVMAELCGLMQVQPFHYSPGGPRRFKLVTFVPEGQADPLAAAMSSAGAGRIGEYEQCSFRLRGVGTFFGSQKTNPRVGRRGNLERVIEIRLEMVAPERQLPDILAALRKYHPYEEPAFDLYPLEPEPEAGIGRVGMLAPGTTLGRLAMRLKKATGSRVVSIVGTESALVKRAAVCVGAAGRLPLENWRSADADVVVTGEIRHHDALTLMRRGTCAIALGHWESERPALTRLADQLRDRAPKLQIRVSRRDCGPFRPA